MRLIDAEEAFELAKEKIYSFTQGMGTLVTVKWLLSDCPTIEAKPVVHAHWEEVQCSKNSVKWLHRVSCSNCHNEGHKRYDYCPHCGAQMDENNTQKMSVDKET